jgi:hypothetical protein
MAYSAIQVIFLVWLLYLVGLRLVRGFQTGIVRLWWVYPHHFVTFPRRTKPVGYWSLMAAYAAWIAVIGSLLILDLSHR